jgi:predicted GNAT family acetyltransferase
VIEVRDNKERLRYEIVVDGVVAGFIQYSMRGGRLILVHTEIKDEFGGRGLATQLVRAALDDARRRDLRIVPICPFVEEYIERHPEYDDLVDHELFERLNSETK